MSLNCSSSRLVTTFAINECISRKLIQNGIRTKYELVSLSASQLQTLCSLTDEENNEIDKIIRRSHESHVDIIDADKMLANSDTQRIKSFCKSIDYALNGGLSLRALTQFAGHAGVGKSQLCLQYCINVQLPQAFGGLLGEAIYIDTDGKFRNDRLQQVARGTLHHCASMNVCDFPLDNLSVDNLVSGVHHVVCKISAHSLCALIVEELEKLIDAHPRVHLVVIDSIAQLFRYDYQEDFNTRAWELTQISQTLRQLAHYKNIAVLITNQVTYNPQLKETLPALGKQWQSVCSTNLMLERDSNDLINIRKGKILKSPTLCEDTQFEFVVCEDGIRDSSRKRSSDE